MDHPVFPHVSHMNTPPGIASGSLMVNGSTEKITLQRFVPLPNPFPVWTAPAELRTFGECLARAGLKQTMRPKTTSDICFLFFSEETPIFRFEKNP
jgi:hypothetical protein